MASRLTVWLVRRQSRNSWGDAMNKKPGLYANMNARKEAGTSRPKDESTIDKKTYSLMTRKAGPFKEKKNA